MSDCTLLYKSSIVLGLSFNKNDSTNNGDDNGLYTLLAIF